VRFLPFGAAEVKAALSRAVTRLDGHDLEDRNPSDAADARSLSPRRAADGPPAICFAARRALLAPSPSSRPEALQRACRGVRDAGYERWDAHAPFPLDGSPT
jgi:hypothetical protein